MTVTRKNVAELAGVSESLVSLYVNGNRKARMSDQTRERIGRAVRELGYRPNQLAQALRRGRSRTIGVVTGGITHRSWDLQVLMNELKAYGYRLNISITNYNREEERETFEDMLNRQVDSMIYLLFLDPEDELWERIRGAHAPVVLQQSTGGELHSVVFERGEPFRMALKEFKRRGHRKVHFLSYYYEQNFELFRQIAKSEGIDAECFLFPNSRVGQMEKMPEFFKEEPEALFSVNHSGVLLNRIFRFFREHGRKELPDAVHGYTRPFAEMCTESVMIGYIHNPFKLLMKALAARAVEIAEKPEEEFREIRIPGHFIPPEMFAGLIEEDLRDPFYASMEDID